MAGKEVFKSRLNADIELELDDSTVEMSKKCRSVDDGRQEARRTSLLLCLIRVATMIAEAPVAAEVV